MSKVIKISDSTELKLKELMKSLEETELPTDGLGGGTNTTDTLYVFNYDTLVVTSNDTLFITNSIHSGCRL